MIQTMALWGAALPALVTIVVLAVARPWRPRERPALRRWGDTASALAVGGAYAVGHVGLAGGPGLGIEGGLLTAALGAAVIGAFQATVSLRWWASRVIWLVWSVVAAAVVAYPLAAPQQWSTVDLLLRVGGLAGLIMMLWVSLAVMANRSFGPAAPAAGGLLVAGSAAVATLGGMASTGQLLAPAALSLGLIFLFALVRPRWTALSAAVPVVAVTVGSHLGASWLYGDLPLLSLVLVAGGSLLLMIGSRPTLRHVRPVVAVASHLALAGLLVALASAPAARAYFSDASPAATSSGDSADDGAGDADYGYD